jgi:ZIP family zinc transporter
MAAVAAFVAARVGCGCGCGEHRELLAGTGMAVALTVHRFLEGAAIALTGSVAVTLALAAHAFGEGLATGALLSGQPRRRVAGCLVLMCVSPVFGAIAADAFPVPEVAGPVLVAAVAGVLAQAALVSLRAAFRGLRPRQLPVSRPAAVTATAALVTVLAVYGAG